MPYGTSNTLIGAIEKPAQHQVCLLNAPVRQIAQTANSRPTRSSPVHAAEAGTFQGQDDEGTRSSVEQGREGQPWQQRSRVYRGYRSRKRSKVATELLDQFRWAHVTQSCVWETQIDTCMHVIAYIYIYIHIMHIHTRMH